MAILNLNSKITYVKPDDYIGQKICGFLKRVKEDTKFRKWDLEIEDEDQNVYVFRLNGNLARGCGLEPTANGGYEFSPIPALGGRTTRGFWVEITPIGKAVAKSSKQQYNAFKVSINTDKYLDFGTLGKPNELTECEDF